MDRKPVIVFLIKVVPLFALFLFLWHAQGLARGYHGLIAGFLDFVYPLFDPTGIVTGVAVKGQEFGIGLIVNGQRSVLSINAVDITSNTALLFSLYFASPLRHRIKVFLLFFISSMVTLFFVHALTVAALSQKAFLTHPVIMAGSPFSKAQIMMIRLYNTFYEQMGMYLLILVLWFPYILWYIRGSRPKAPSVDLEQSSKNGAAGTA